MTVFDPVKNSKYRFFIIHKRYLLLYSDKSNNYLAHTNMISQIQKK